MIKSENISLRAMEISDAEILYQWENDTSIWHLSNTLAPFSKFALEQYIINSHQDIYSLKQIRLMIDLHQGDAEPKTIGSIDLFEFEPKHLRAGVGILIHTNYRGKGYASEALDILSDYAFNTIGLHQLFCNIGPDNEDSLKLFTNKGFEIIGKKKEWNRINNSWNDEMMLQLISNP